MQASLAVAAQRRRPGWTLFASVLLALNLMFRAPALLGSSGLSGLLIPSLDAALLVLLVCLWSWLRLPGEKLLAVLLAVCALFLVLFHCADTLVPAYFDRALVLATDATYLPDLYALLRDTTSPWLFYPGLVAASLVLTALGYGLYRALRLLHRCFDAAAYRSVFVGVAGGLALLLVSGAVPMSEASALPRVAHEVTGLARRESYLAEKQRYFAARGQASTTLDAEASKPLSRLGGRDVLLFIVESYGYTLYSEPRHFEAIEADLGRHQAALEDAGYSVVSAYLTSPAFGGNSWLADSTLTTGLKIDNQSAYELLLASEVKPMAEYFNEAGYRTVVAMPGTTTSWPEGEFFRFQKKYYYRDFGYRGPSLRWAPMTDQFVLDTIHRREVAVATQPLFVQYVLISSHYPFNLIPRYFDDWSAVGDGSIYAREDSVTVVPIPPGSSTAGAEGYVAAIRYDLNLITEYASRFLPGDDNSLIVVLGDHQPYSGITGRGKAWSVPIHILSRDLQVLEPFRRRGYTSGWVPRQPLPHPGMEDFLPALLADFGTAGGRLVGGADAGSR